MIAKVQEKEKALELRRKGYTYNDILAELEVSKSSLSLWLKSLPLTDNEKTYLKKRKDSNISKGRIRAASALHMRRVVRDGFLFRDARREFLEHCKKPIFHVGVSLYWAEGGKRTSSFAFMNSDPDMVRLMVAWIGEFLGAKKEEIGLRLYSHKPFAHEGFEQFWAKETQIPSSQFKKTVYKPTGLLVKKRPDYRGCVRIELGKVVYLRKMKYWQQMLIEHHGK